MAAKSRKQQLQDLLKEEPNDPFLRYGLAMELASEGKDEEAVRCFQELLEATPEYVPGYLQAGQALARLGRCDEARTVFGRGIVVARTQGDQHAAAEMEGLLANLD